MRNFQDDIPSGCLIVIKIADGSGGATSGTRNRKRNGSTVLGPHDANGARPRVGASGERPCARQPVDSKRNNRGSVAPACSRLFSKTPARMPALRGRPRQCCFNTPALLGWVSLNSVRDTARVGSALMAWYPPTKHGNPITHPARNFAYRAPQSHTIFYLPQKNGPRGAGRKTFARM